MNPLGMRTPLPCAAAGGGMEITAIGASFSPRIEVASGASILWTFADGTTSTSASPTKNYGTAIQRVNRLRVTPWNALLGFNVGYTADDGGSTSIPTLSQQSVVSITGLDLAAASLRYFCCALNPIEALDFTGFSQLTTVEAYFADRLATINFTGCTALRRACIEKATYGAFARIAALDLSDSPNFQDLRAAKNDIRTLAIPAGGMPDLWHWCIWLNDHAPQWPLSQFGAAATSAHPLQLWLSNTNQTGTPDLPPLAALTGCSQVNISVSANPYSQAGIDAWLDWLDSSGVSNGIFDISQTTAPSAAGYVHADSLRAKGWNVQTA